MNDTETPLVDVRVNVKNGSHLYKFYLGLRASVLSPFNEWVTGVAVGHTPTFEEKLFHFITHGGLASYRRRFYEENPGVMFVQ